MNIRITRISSGLTFVLKKPKKKETLDLNHFQFSNSNENKDKDKKENFDDLFKTLDNFSNK